jgi:hypothetical protein
VPQATVPGLLVMLALSPHISRGWWRQHALVVDSEGSGRFRGSHRKQAMIATDLSSPWRHIHEWLKAGSLAYRLAGPGSGSRHSFHERCSMNRHHLTLLALLVVLSGCSDHPLWETPLPNGYVHRSTDDGYGVIIKPKNLGGGTLFPLGMQRDGRKLWCDNFGIQGQFVMCEVVEYGENSGHKPLSIHYLVLNTESGGYKTYSKKELLISNWNRYNQQPLPELRRAHKSRRRIEE